MNKRKVLGTILGILIWSFCIVFFTFAYYNWRSTNSLINFNITDETEEVATELEISIPNPEINAHNIGPVLDYTVDGVIVDFTIKNLTEITRYVKISLNISSITENLIDSTFKYKVLCNTTGQNEELASGNFADLTTGENVLVSSYTIDNPSSHTCKFIAYIDGNVENNIELQGGSLVATLDVEELGINITYNSSNILYGLNSNVSNVDCGGATYSISNKTITVTGNNDNGNCKTNGRVYLEANKKYVFSAQSTGTWDKNGSSGSVQGYLKLLNENTTGNYIYVAGENYEFTVPKTGIYYLRFDANGSGTTATFSNISISHDMGYSIVEYNTPYGELLEPELYGHTFTGWYTSLTGGTKITEDSILESSEPQTLYARWTPKTYTVSANPNNGTIATTTGWSKIGTGTTIPYKKTVTFGEPYGTLPNITRTDYTLSGWYSGASIGDINIAAQNSTHNYSSVIYNVTPGATYNITINKATLLSGIAGDFTSTIYDHTSQTKLAEATLDFGNNVTYTLTCPESAVETNDIRILIYSGVAGSTTNVATSFQGITVTSTEPTDYEIYTANTIVTTPRNHNIYAQWLGDNASTYIITFNPNGGSVTTTNKTVTNGSTYGTLPTPTKDGYTFTGWYTATSGGTQITSSTIVNLTGNQTLYARWVEQKTYFYTNSGTPVNSWTPGRVQTSGYSWSTSGGLKATCNGNWGPTYWYTTANLTNYSKLCYSLHYNHYGSSSTVRETSVSVGVISSFTNPDRFVSDSTYGQHLYSGLTFNANYSKTWNSCQLKAADGSTNCYYYTKNYTETGCIDVSGLSGNQIIGFADRGDGEAGAYSTTLYYMYGE